MVLVLLIKFFLYLCQNNKMEEPTNHGNSDSVYYKLMEEVGVHGKYQTGIIVLCCVLLFQIGAIQLGIPYYFAVAPYSNCPEPYTGITFCTQYACSKPYSERSQYQNQQIRELKTLGNQFGDYHCEKSDAITEAMGVNYVGAIVGYIITSMLADNIGRRVTLLLCELLAVGGYGLTLLAPTLFVAEVGLFIAGFGVQSFFGVSFCLMSQLLQNKHRQKIEILIQGFTGIGGIFIVFMFYLLKEWKIIFVLVQFLPILTCLIFSYFFVRETPQFLIRLYQVEEIRENMRFIAEMNETTDTFDSSYLLSEDHLLELKEDYEQQMEGEHKKAFTYIDLIRYPSLRWITIWAFVLFFCSSFLYFAPLIIVDEFGFDFYVNGVILNVSELVTLVISYFFITSLKRKLVNIITFTVALFSSFWLIFLNNQEVCTENCWNLKQIVELIVFFVMRFAISLQYQVLFLYVAELYPAQVSALGLGFGCLMVAVPNVFLPEMINLLNRVGFKLMIVFCIVAAIAIAASFPLKETDGKHPEEKIEELAHKEHHHQHHQYVKHTVEE